MKFFKGVCRLMGKKPINVISHQNVQHNPNYKTTEIYLNFSNHFKLTVTLSSLENSDESEDAIK